MTYVDLQFDSNNRTYHFSTMLLYQFWLKDEENPSNSVKNHKIYYLISQETKR